MMIWRMMLFFDFSNFKDAVPKYVSLSPPKTRHLLRCQLRNSIPMVSFQPVPIIFSVVVGKRNATLLQQSKLREFSCSLKSYRSPESHTWSSASKI